MDSINYEDLSQAELVKLLREKDVALEEKEQEIDDMTERFSDFVSGLIHNSGIDDIEIGTFESIKFNDLIVETDEEDNSREVSSAETIHDKNEAAFKTIADAVYSGRKALFTYAVDNWIHDYKQGRELYIGDSGVGIMNRLEVNYDDYKFVNQQLSKLVGKISLSDFNNHLGLREIANIYSNSYQTHNKNGVFTDEKVQEAVKIFINHMLSLPEFKLGIFDTPCSTFEDKEKKLLSYFPKCDFLLTYKARKEKKELEEIINNTDIPVAKSGRRI